MSGRRALGLVLATLAGVHLSYPDHTIPVWGVVCSLVCGTLVPRREGWYSYGGLAAMVTGLSWGRGCGDWRLACGPSGRADGPPRMGCRSHWSWLEGYLGFASSLEQSGYIAQQPPARLEVA
ncbi:hypothetical protein B0T25DRAFT_236505 [Lasiosphaeria hispida]|uniref:Uncharacterized protein n=1 Tax=Lasiosphaeria hispida TaxID=260671 RepID=A0AAJ0MC15_9PEZI|nr:hypothetical protein B0T25DRAFT_236505 [Lasiosphaeria hispida]